MIPNQISKPEVFPGEPAAADPVEVLAYALWNEGREDEAIAVLERQIALEKKLSESRGSEATDRPAEMTLFPLPAAIAAAPAERPRPAIAANQNQAGSEVALVSPRRVPQRRAAGQPKAAPVTVYDGPYREPVSRRRLALISGLLLLLFGGAGLWASPDGTESEVAQPAAQVPAPAMTASVQPSDPDVSAGEQDAGAPEPVTAVGNATPTSPPAEAEDLPLEEDIPAETDDLPAEAEESLAGSETPPAEDAAPEAPVQNAGPGGRVEPATAPPVSQAASTPAKPQVKAAAKPVAKPAPTRAVKPAAKPAPVRAAKPAAKPRVVAKNPSPKPAVDARSERSRRLAERRQAAERYAARRRAEAERTAAARQRRAPPAASAVPGRVAPRPASQGPVAQGPVAQGFVPVRPPRQQGPEILLGGRGLP